jgi:hypothetical protein
MSGLFTDLAARARGEAHAVRPRLPARFETSGEGLAELAVEATAIPAAEGDLEPPEPAAETTAAPAPTVASPPSAEVAEPPVEAPQRLRASPRPPATAAVELHTVVERAEPAADGPSPPRGETRVPPAPAPSLAPSTSLRPPETVQHPVSAAQPLTPPPQPSGREATAEARPPLTPQLTPARRQPAQPLPEPIREETTVHVSIGRIELRAAQGAPPPRAKPREAEKPAVMSLNDYLQSRRAAR